jgi:hypothetical protein
MPAFSEILIRKNRGRLQLHEAHVTGCFFVTGQLIVSFGATTTSQPKVIGLPARQYIYANYFPVLLKTQRNFHSIYKLLFLPGLFD